MESRCSNDRMPESGVDSRDADLVKSTIALPLVEGRTEWPAFELPMIGECADASVATLHVDDEDAESIS